MAHRRLIATNPRLMGPKSATNSDESARICDNFKAGPQSTEVHSRSRNCNCFQVQMQVWGVIRVGVVTSGLCCCTGRSLMGAQGTGGTHHTQQNTGNTHRGTYMQMLFRKRRGDQNSMGNKVPWEIGMMIYLPVTSRRLISLQKEAVLLSPCNFATSHLTAFILDCFWARTHGYCKRGSGGQRKIEKIRATFWDSNLL